MYYTANSVAFSAVDDSFDCCPQMQQKVVYCLQWLLLDYRSLTDVTQIDVGDVKRKWRASLTLTLIG